MEKKTIFLSTLLFIIISCNEIRDNNTNNNISLNNSNIKYAKGFEIQENDTGYLLSITNKYSIKEKEEYILSRNYNNDKSNHYINIPIKKVICFSSTHSAFICQIGEASSIVGLSGTDYIYNEYLTDRISNNLIIDIGYDNNINYEKIIALKPDLIFAYNISNSSSELFNKLTDNGLKLIYINDYLETSALGRTEWIKFISCFYDKYHYACHYFDSVEFNYNHLKHAIQSKTPIPRVLVGLPWLGTWWVPGSNSYFANFIKDANARYVFSNNSSEESIPLSIEDVFFKVDTIDIWLNPNSITEKQQIIKTDKRFEHFIALKTAKIYNNNKRSSSKGGMDFWESGIVHPDIILKDLINIFHYPDSCHNLFYYQLIK